MDITLSLTAPKIAALNKLDPAKTAKQVLQTHVDTWLAPLVAELVTDDRKAVALAYLAADAPTQTSVKELLGLG